MESLVSDRPGFRVDGRISTSTQRWHAACITPGVPSDYDVIDVERDTMRRNIWSVLLLGCLAAGCADDGVEYDPNWGEDQSVPGGKADLLDHAPLLTFDEPGTGSVDAPHMDIFKAELTRGDQIELRKSITSGDLAPDFTLYRGATSPMSSSSFDVQPEKLTKLYTITESATYMIAVRAYRNQGAGEYKLELICRGGTCDGEPVPPAAPDEMWRGDVEDCVVGARVCAIEALPAYNGRVGAATAARIFDNCLAQQMTSDDLSCARACEAGDGVDDYCESVKAALPDLADQPAECISTLESCMSDCTDFDYNNYSDEFYDTDEAMCWDGGLNGNCQLFAAQMPECGGSLQNETAQCFARCESTFGALVDDLSGGCEEECGECGIACWRDRDDLWTTLPTDGLVGDVIDHTTFDSPEVCAVTVRVDKDGDGELPAGIYGILSPEDDCDYRGVFEVGQAIHVPLDSLTDDDPDDISSQERFGWLANSEDVERWFRYSGDGADEIDL